MKLFGFIKITTKKELLAKQASLQSEIETLRDACLAFESDRNAVTEDMRKMKKVFPFELGQTVYDLQLRNEMGRYAKKNPSLMHSIINEVIVDEKNYFNLVERYKKNDVFINKALAKSYLETICKK